MTTLDDPFARWDAAYVLGALSPEDRRAYEEHLAGCVGCQQAVAEVAGLPGMLAQVSPEDGTIWSEAPSSRVDAELPGTLLPTLITRVRSRRRLLTTLVGVAAGLVLLVGGIGIGARVLPADPPDRLAFAAVVDSPVTAVADVVAEGGGTRIQVECQYGGGSTQQEPGRLYPEYSIVVVDRGDRAVRIKDWYVKPGKVMHPQAHSDLRPAQIKRIEIQRTDTGQTLLQTTLR